MKKQHPKLYEGMFIFNANLSADAMDKALNKVKSLIEEHKGEIHKVHDWGRRKLAYEIDHQKQGHYFLLYFSIVSSALIEMNSEHLLNEDLIRHQVLKTDTVPEKIEFKPLPEG
jgi:small subunit ribosomal protein S6